MKLLRCGFCNSKAQEGLHITRCSNIGVCPQWDEGYDSPKQWNKMQRAILAISRKRTKKEHVLITWQKRRIASQKKIIQKYIKKLLAVKRSVIARGWIRGIPELSERKILYSDVFVEIIQPCIRRAN